MSFCPRRRGTRSTTSTPRTCTPSSTPSTRPSPRRGSPRPTGRPGRRIAKKFSELAVDHLGVRKDVVAKPLWHDTPEAMATVHGRVKDWRTGESSRSRARPCRPSRGRRARLPRDLRQDDVDRPAHGEGRHAHQGRGLRRRTRDRHPARAQRHVRTGVGAGQPKMETDIQVADAILHLSGTTNGHLATHGFKFLEKRTGTKLHDLSAEHEGKQITFADTQIRAGAGHHLAGMVGSESGGRRYSPFTINIERLQALPHPDRSTAVLPRPRLDDRHGRGAAGLPTAAEHDQALRRDAGRQQSELGSRSAT
jgi:hypothetical protein